MPRSRREPVACGVDIGTTNVKVAAVDHDGAVRARASRPTPRDAQGLSIEGSVLVDTVEAMIVEACSDAYQADALCTVGVGEDGLLLDADLRPLTEALAWFDPRRQEILRIMRAQFDNNEVYDAADDAARTMVGWAWARQQSGAEEARAWVAVADLPAVLWTGRTFLSDTLASRTGAWRASSRAWASDRVARALGSDKLLPSVLSAGDVVGTISSSPFASAGAVRSDAIVVAGGHDHSVGGWVVDRLVPGAVLDSMGTAEVVVAQSPSPPSRAPRQVDIAPGICSSGTTVLRVVELAHNVSWAAQDPAVAQWIRALIDGTAHPVAVLEAGYFRPGRLGDSPSYTLEAPRDPHAKASAVLGALAGAGRASVNAVCAGAVDSRLVRLAGGWARSPGWLEIKKTINGYDATTIPEPEVTAVGAAFLGATALGWEPDPARALGGASEIERGW